MTFLKYYFLIIILLSCGAKKSQTSKEFELSKKINTKEIVETSKDTLNFQEWSWIKKSNFKLSPKDPAQESKVHFHTESNSISFQNAVIESNGIEVVSKKDRFESKNDTTEKNTNDKATEITNNEQQSKSREQFKIQLWHLAPILLVIGVAYIIINHRTIILKFIKRKLLKLLK